MEIKNLTTEQRNPATMHIDSMSTIDMVKTINKEDQKVAVAVGTQDDKIAQAIDEAAKRYSKGGRLIYIGWRFRCCRISSYLRYQTRTRNRINCWR